MAEVEQKLPTYAWEQVDKHPHSGEDFFEAEGPGRQFRDLSNKHYAEIEKEMGNESPGQLYSGGYWVTKDGE